MRLWLTLFFCVFRVGTFATPSEDIIQKERINKLRFEEKPFAKLSHQDISENAKKALKIQPAEWKHAESDHFIIHYQPQPWEIRDRFAKEAEFYYWKIKEDLQLTNDRVDHKSHIFIFQDEARWRQFLANADANDFTFGGITIGNDFFCRKEKEYSGTVAHEMTHLVFNRFFAKNPPRWLNEGFAEYQSQKDFRIFYSQGVPVKKNTSANASAVDKIDFLEMTRWQTCPKGDFVPALYAKSRLAVKILVEKGDYKRFVEFMTTLIENNDFEAAFAQHYLEKFQSLDNFLKELVRKEKKL